MNRDDRARHEPVRARGYLAIFMLVITAILVTVGWFVRWSFQTPTMRVSLLAHDWESVSFDTEVEGTVQESVVLGFNTAGGGVVGGEAQYMLGGVTGGSSEPPYLKGIQHFTVSDAIVTIFDMSDVRAAPLLDDERTILDAPFLTPTFNYALSVYEPISDDLEFIYTPFETIPEIIRERTIFTKTQPISLTVSVPDRQAVGGLPRWTVLTSEPLYWAWSLSPNCTTEVRRITDPVDQLRLPLLLRQDCSTETSFELSEYAPPTAVELYAERVLILVDHYQAFEGQTQLNGDTTNYLILIEAGNESQGFRLAAELTDAVSTIQVVPRSRNNDSNSEVFQLAPNLKDNLIRMSGATGNLAVGLNTHQLDELSDLTIQYDEQLAPVSVHDRIVVNEDGTQRTIQLLSLNGQVKSVVLNGEELVLNHWHSLPDDVQGSILGATIASLFTLAGWLGSTWLLKRSPPPDPLIEVNPVVYITPEPQRKSNGLWAFFKRMFVRSSEHDH